MWVDKYASWRDFQKVLKRAQLDFVDHGSLSFDYEGLSQGRMTTQVRFRINRKDEVTKLPAEADPALAAQKRKLASRLEAAGYNQDALKAVETYGIDVTEMALKLALIAERTGARSDRPIYNTGGLIHHALKTGLAKRRLDKAEPAESKPDPKLLARSLADAFTAARQNFAETVWETMLPEDKNGFPGIMQLELSSFEVTQLEKAGWEGSLFESSKRELLLSLYADEIPDELAGVRAFAEHTGFLRDFDKKTSAAILTECDVLYL